MTTRFFWDAYDAREAYTPLVEDVEASSLEEAKQAAKEYRDGFKIPVRAWVTHEEFIRDNYGNISWIKDDSWHLAPDSNEWVKNSSLDQYNMVSYSTNWMGPVNMEWIKKYGDNWATGRIDIRGTGEPYGDEMHLPPMDYKDWSRFSEWLDDFYTDYMWTLSAIVKEYEKTNPPITWLNKEEVDE